MKSTSLAALAFAVSAQSFATPVPFVRGSDGTVVKNFSENCWTSFHADSEEARLQCLESNEGVKVTVAPRQAPTPVAAAPKVVVKSLFAFNRARLKKEDKEQLNLVAVQLKTRAVGEKIVVRGFADPLGNAARNKKLSQRRAEAAKKFLVKKGIPVNSIVAEGLGVVTASDKNCSTGSLKQKIECLKTERRVEVELPANGKTL